jgi:hypothetical protein
VTALIRSHEIDAIGAYCQRHVSISSDVADVPHAEDCSTCDDCLITELPKIRFDFQSSGATFPTDARNLSTWRVWAASNTPQPQRARTLSAASSISGGTADEMGIERTPMTWSRSVEQASHFEKPGWDVEEKLLTRALGSSWRRLLLQSASEADRAEGKVEAGLVNDPVRGLRGEVCSTPQCCSQ